MIRKYITNKAKNSTVKTLIVFDIFPIKSESLKNTRSMKKA